MAFLLDTNVVSETVKPRPHRPVLDWIEAQNPSDLFLAAQSLIQKCVWSACCGICKGFCPSEAPKQDPDDGQLQPRQGAGDGALEVL